MVAKNKLKDAAETAKAKAAEDILVAWEDRINEMANGTVTPNPERAEKSASPVA